MEYEDLQLKGFPHDTYFCMAKLLEQLSEDELVEELRVVDGVTHGEQREVAVLLATHLRNERLEVLHDRLAVLQRRTTVETRL